MANRCFLEQGQLWENLDRIHNIPITIVHGRFDMPCQLATAYRLHQQLPRSRLVIVERGGHGGSPILKAVANAVRNHEPR
jgi:proline iminopeptidase